MRKFKLPILMSLVLTSAFVFTSCGGGEPSEEDGVKIVTVWVHKNETEDEGKIYKQLQTNFNNAGYTTSDGTQLRISMSFWGTTLEDKINASIMTNSLPDIVAVDSSDVAAKVYNDIIVSFDEYLSDEVKNTYVDSVIKQGTIDGEMYFLSGMEAPGGLYYNKNLLKQVGYTEEDFGTLENPWSWKDVHTAQQALKDAGLEYQIALNQNFGTDGNMYLYSGLVYSAGANFGTDNHVTEALTTQEAVSGIAQLEMFYSNEGLTGSESWVYNGTNENAFAQELIPFQIHGPWDAREIKKSDSAFKDNYGIMPYPVYEDESGNKSDIVASPCGSYGFGITNDSKNIEASTIVLTYLTGETASEMMYDAIGTFPTNKNLLDTMEEFKSGPEQDLASYLVSNQYTRPQMVKYPVLKDAYGEVLNYIKNMNLVSNYDLENQIREQMERVDAARA